MRRVVITGQGTINALSSSAQGTFEAFREGRCGIGPLDIRDVDRLAIQIGGQVRGFDPQSACMPPARPLPKPVWSSRASWPRNRASFLARLAVG